MADQNWYLQAHYHAQTPHSSVTFSNLNSGPNVTKDDGTTTNVNYGNFPVFRLVAKITLETASNPSNSYVSTRFGGGASGQWDGVNWYSQASNTQYSSQNSGNYGSDNGQSRNGIYHGTGTMVSHYNYYGWGASVTDSQGVSVPGYNARRQTYTTFDISNWTNGNFYAGGVGSGSGCYNGSSATDLTSEANAGAWNIFCGGESGVYGMADLYFSTSNTFVGDLLLYRSGNLNYVGGS